MHVKFFISFAIWHLTTRYQSTIYILFNLTKVISFQSGSWEKNSWKDFHYSEFSGKKPQIAINLREAPQNQSYGSIPFRFPKTQPTPHPVNAFKEFPETWSLQFHDKCPDNRLFTMWHIKASVTRKSISLFSKMFLPQDCFFRICYCLWKPLVYLAIFNFHTKAPPKLAGRIETTTLTTFTFRGRHCRQSSFRARVTSY